MILFILILLLDILILRNIVRDGLPMGTKILFACIVILVPILGIALYYFLNQNIRRSNRRRRC